MTLTLGPAPFGTKPRGDANFTLDAPPHRLWWEADPRRLRALVGDTVVLDTRRVHLLHESNILPVAYAPVEDFADGVLEPTATSTHCPFKGDASYRTVRAGDRVLEDAVWLYEEPLERASWLRGFAALRWDAADAWLVEDEPVTGHLRDPYHRVDAHLSSRAVTVRAADEIVAHSERPVMVFETGLAPRPYLPRADVRAGALAPSATRTHCPYKGEASYWDVLAGGARLADAGWSYEAPLGEAMRAASCVCFDGEGIEVEID